MLHMLTSVVLFTATLLTVTSLPLSPATPRGHHDDPPPLNTLLTDLRAAQDGATYDLRQLVHEVVSKVFDDDEAGRSTAPRSAFNSPSKKAVKSFLNPLISLEDMYYTPVEADDEEPVSAGRELLFRLGK